MELWATVVSFTSFGKYVESLKLALVKDVGHGAACAKKANDLEDISYVSAMTMI